MKNILITGINGQDGVILTSKLLNNFDNINILGTSRTPNLSSFQDRLGIFHKAESMENINIVDINFFDINELTTQINQFKPDVVFNLMGPSNVNKSLGNEDYYNKNIFISFQNLVKTLDSLNERVKFFQASSSEMYAESAVPLTEKSQFKPRNPYSEAKYKIKNSIETNSLNLENLIFMEGIMFNHDSELRSQKFLILKIVNDVINIYKKNMKKTTVGSLDYVRDWSYAGDIMDASIKMIQLDTHQSFNLGSGTGTSIKQLLEIAFSEFNLDWSKYVSLDARILRNNDPIKIVSDPSSIQEKIGWKTNLTIEDLLSRLIKFTMDMEN
jgi:GDPmannose 4,6-dehydratase